MGRKKKKNVESSDESHHPDESDPKRSRRSNQPNPGGSVPSNTRPAAKDQAQSMTIDNEGFSGDSEKDFSIPNNFAHTHTRTRVETSPPPITIENVRIVQLRQQISTVIQDASKITYKVGNNTVKIFAANFTVYESIRKFCVENNFAGFSHTPREERLIRFCLYGLWSMETEILKNELKKLKIEPCKIRELTLRNRKYDDQAIFVISFKRNQNVDLIQLKSIKSIFNVIVSWKYYENKTSEPVQCTNCQGLGHGTERCFKAAKCVRCSGAHSSKSCPLIPPLSEVNDPKHKPIVAKELLKCALCEGNHVSTYRLCEKRIEFKQSKEKFRTLQKRTKLTTKDFGLQRQLPHFDSRTEFPPLVQDIPKPSEITSPTQKSKMEEKSSQTETEFNASASQTDILPAESPLYNLMPLDECISVYHQFLIKLSTCTTVQEQIHEITEMAKLTLSKISKYPPRGS